MTVPQTEIIIRKDGAEVDRRVVEPGEYLIGRGDDCAFQVIGEKISRQHARLHVNYDEWLVEDLGSANGTFINDDAVPPNSTTRVFPTQSLRVGDVEVTLRRLKPEQPGESLPPSAAIARVLLPEEMIERRYAVGKIVAQGGMGAILSAQDQAIQRGVAMKVMLNSADPGDVARFVAEARVTGGLEHPNIVPVHELGVDEQGQPFYTMKMVQGITLKKVLELVAQGVAATLVKYPLSVLLTVFQKVCDAVAFAHSRGIIHRDLKPENIMVGDFGEVLLMDWGLAKRIGERPASSVQHPTSTDAGIERTMTGTVMGTPQYMAPEQARGEIEKLDARTDIYALGAILFNLLSLRPSVSGNDAWAVVTKVARGDVNWEAISPQTTKRSTAPDNAPKLAHLPAGRVPESLAAVVRKAMALSPAQRYAVVPELQADIAAFQGGFATSAENAGAWKQLTLFVRRHKAASIGVAAVLLIGGTLGTKALIEGRRAERALTELKGKAPAMLKLADSEASQQNFVAALENADTALALDPSYLPAYWRRAWLLIGMERWRDAAQAIRLAHQKDPTNIKHAAILPIIEQIAESPSDAERWNAGRSEPLLAHLQAVGANGEIVKLSDVLIKSGKGRAQLIRQRIGEWLGKDTGYSVTVDKDGSITVLLLYLGRALTTLDGLRGLPIDHLTINRTSVTSLEPLRGMKLRSLYANGVNIADLSPLQGMPIRNLELSRDLKESRNRLDFTPLKGAPLERLIIDNCLIVDLLPLKGAPLRYVSMQGVGVADLTFLADSPIVYLKAYVNPIRDLSPLRGKPIQFLDLNDTKVKDLSPLKGTPIEELKLGGTSIADYSLLLDLPKLRRLAPHSANSPTLAALRTHPTLELINDVAVAKFWAAYDAKPK